MGSEARPISRIWLLMEKDDAEESDNTGKRKNDAPKRDGSREADTELARRKREHH